ncbi:MAG: NEW3 domain-containing protein [Niabella sp.]
MLLKKSFIRPRQLRHCFLFSFLLSVFAVKSNFSNAQQAPPPPTGKPAFTARLMNIEAASNETFRYNTTLYNGATDSRVYELKADLPIGWLIAFKADGSQVTSLNLDAGKTRDISIEINAASGAKPQKYTIPIKAISGSDTLSLTLEAVVKGSYAIELTTPDGRLSEEVTSGSHQSIHFIVKNSGTIPLTDINVSAQAPTKWETAFEPAKIPQLDPGKTADVTATLTIPDKTIAGDYAATFSVKNANANAQAAFRIIVKTSILSGWIGILVILLAIGLIYYLIRKYGRR